jgi:hypothetical protein
MSTAVTQPLVAPGQSGSGFYTNPNYPQGYPGVPPMPPTDETNVGPYAYPYDGGPQYPVPMPGGYGVNPPAAPTRTPPATVPLEGRVVSLPAQTGGQTQRYSYQAYGEGSSFAIDRVAPPTQVARKTNGR